MHCNAPEEQRGEPTDVPPTKHAAEEQRGEPTDVPPTEHAAEEQHGEHQEQRGESEQCSASKEVVTRKRKRRRYSKSKTWRTGIINHEASHVLEH